MLDALPDPDAEADSVGLLDRVKLGVLDAVGLYDCELVAAML